MSTSTSTSTSTEAQSASERPTILTEAALYRGATLAGEHYGTGTLTVWYDASRGSGVGRFCCRWSDYYDGRVIEFGEYASLEGHLGTLAGRAAWHPVAVGGGSCADDRTA